MFRPIDIGKNDKFKLDIIWPLRWRGCISCLHDIHKSDTILNMCIFGGRYVDVRRYKNIYFSTYLKKQKELQHSVYRSIIMGIKYMERILKIPIFNGEIVFINSPNSFMLYFNWRL